MPREQYLFKAGIFFCNSTPDKNNSAPSLQKKFAPDKKIIKQASDFKNIEFIVCQQYIQSWWSGGLH